MILPITARSAMRFRPLSKSTRGISLSITGRASPIAILCMLSARLRTVAPKEAMMRICCWNRWKRLVSAEMPLVDPQVRTVRVPGGRGWTAAWKWSAAVYRRTPQVVAQKS